MASKSKKARKRTQGKGDPDIYICSGCGLRDAANHWAVSIDFPLIGSLRERLWQRCPDDGGADSCDLYDPEDSSRYSRRFAIPRDGRVIRACTRMVRTPTSNGLFRGVPAIVPRDIGCAMVVETARKRVSSKRRPIDLAELWPVHGDVMNVHDQRLVITERPFGRWYGFNPMIERDTEWDWRATRHARTEEDRGKWLELTAILDPWTSLAEPAKEARRKASVLVSIDMRFPIDKQFEALEPGLREIQQHLQNMSGRERAKRYAPSDVRRDAYCYFLAEIVGKKSREIASDVFPKENQGTAVNKVDKIVSAVRRMLDALPTKPDG